MNLDDPIAVDVHTRSGAPCRGPRADASITVIGDRAGTPAQRENARRLPAL